MDDKLHETMNRSYGSHGNNALADGHCGPGSTFWYTEPIRKKLVPFLQKHNINSMLDAPCGDFQWMNLVKFPENFDYLGADISHELVNRNNSLYGNRFKIIDITEDFLPSKDLMFVRDCLFHFSARLKLKFFQNFLCSDFKYLLTSNHPRHMLNQDLDENLTYISGAFNENINWKLSPWNFPEPIDVLLDYDETNPKYNEHQYRTMNLWTYEQVKQTIIRYKEVYDSNF